MASRKYTWRDAIPFTPETGKRYRNQNGVEYECRAGKEGKHWDDHSAWFVSPKGWAFKAISCVIFPDGSIEWAHSLYGHFING